MIQQIFEMFDGQSELAVLVEIVLFLLFLAIVVSELIELLKGKIIKPEKAGVWSKWANMAVSIVTIILVNAGAGEQADKVVEFASAFAAMAAQLVIQVVGSKGWHELMKKTGGHIAAAPVVEAPEEVG